MTSGTFKTVPISSITVVREARQRRELRNIPDLAQSIAARGLIHPPVVTQDLVLVAGERRLEACKSLQWDRIPVQFAENLDEEELQLIELEENTKRLDITWQEQVSAVHAYHKLQVQREPEWNLSKSADALSLSVPHVSSMVQVGDNLDKPEIAKAPTYSTALSIVERKKAREKSATIKTAIAAITPMRRDDEQVEEPEEPQAPLENADCLEWAKSYTGPLFTFVHCDFPYGINANTAPTTEKGAYNTTAAVRLGGYDDDPEVFFNLTSSLPSLPIAETAHLMFWFPMRYYTWTLKELESQGWAVDPYPLIWHKSDNVGVLPDPKRGGRRTYETAFHCIRGNAFVSQAVAMSYSCPTGRSERIHMSEKPQPMLEHFFRMYVDEFTTMLDPTCGSASSVRAANKLGASRVLGIEKDSELFERAIEAWK